MYDEQKEHSQQGLTLIELVISIVILGIISLVSYGVIALNARTFNSVRDNTLANWDVRRAMQILRHDIQEIRPQNLISEADGSLSGARLRFTSLDGNTITYRKDGEYLQRRVNLQDWLTLVSGIQQNPFQYLNISSNSTNNKNNVVFIKVTLESVQGSKTVTLEDKFYVRN